MIQKFFHTRKPFVLLEIKQKTIRLVVKHGSDYPCECFDTPEWLEVHLLYHGKNLILAGETFKPSAFKEAVESVINQLLRWRENKNFWNICGNIVEQAIMQLNTK